MWSEKYRPRALDRMVGNEEARLALEVWLENWEAGSKAALLMGPPGTGKTTMVSLLAKKEGMNLIELNASDVRTKDMLEREMGEAMHTVSLFGERSLVFLDEVDGLAGRSDYGAIEYIKASVKESQNPIVMAANDPDSDEVRKLGSSCLTIRIRPPPPREVEMFLRDIASRERLQLSDEEFRSCVTDAGGDVRQAVNLMQSRPASHPSHDSKDVDRTLSEAMNGFFSAGSPEAAAASLRGLSLNPFEKVREVQRAVVTSGLPPEALARALEVISRADLFIGKMMKSGDWRLLRYLDRLFVQELFPIVKGMGVRYGGNYDLPWPMMTRVWNDSRKITDISRRYAVRAGTSGMSARSQDLPYLFSLCGKKKFREDLERSLGLDADADVLESYDRFLQKEAAR